VQSGELNKALTSLFAKHVNNVTLSPNCVILSAVYRPTFVLWDIIFRELVIAGDTNLKE